MLEGQSQVSFDVPWFLEFNMVLVAFSFTLVVHVNCLFNAARLVWRYPKDKMYAVSLVQNMCAVACHVSRTTDYFFVTDCVAKPFHNYTQYWLSICAMDLIVIWRDMRLVGAQFRLAPMFRAIVWVFLGLAPLLSKSATMLLTISSLKGSMGKFAICHLDLADAYFAYSHWCWIAYHTAMLMIHSGLLLDSKHCISLPFQRRSRQTPCTDKGTLLLLTSDLTTISLLLLLLKGSLTLGGPDLVLQSMWAIKSKCVAEMLNRSAEHTPPPKTSQPNPSSSDRNSTYIGSLRACNSKDISPPPLSY